MRHLPQDPLVGGYQIQTTEGPLIFSEAELIGKQVRQVAELLYGKMMVLIEVRLKQITARQKEDREEVDRLKKVVLVLQRDL